MKVYILIIRVKTLKLYIECLPKHGICIVLSLFSCISFFAIPLILELDLRFPTLHKEQEAIFKICKEWVLFLVSIIDKSSHSHIYPLGC